MENPKKGKIESLNEALYKRGAPSVIEQKYEPLTSSLKEDVNQNWNNDEHLQELIGQAPKKKRSFLKTFFIVALIFFTISLTVSLVAIFGNFNNISSKNVDISVLGPVSISGGEQLSLEIIIENKNNTALETVDLLIEYPSGTRVPINVQTELLRHRESLGRIEQGDNIRRTVSSVLFGEKDSIKNILISVEYRVKGSNAVFSKEKVYEVALTSSPITLTASYPREISSNKEFEITLEATSNATSLIKGALVRAEYPFGFALIKSTPKTVSNDNVWSLGDLKPGERRVIKIQGKVEAQDEEERTFRFSAGVAKENDDRVLGVEFVNLLETLAIKRSGIGLDLVLGGSAASSVVSTAGGKVSGSVKWVNNLSVPVINAKIEVKFAGGSFDRSSVNVSNNGFFRSVDNTIVWDRNSNSNLADIAPGARGELGFSFASLSNSGGLPLSNQNITVEVVGTGSQVSGGSVPSSISSSLTKTVNIASDIGLNTRIVYSLGAFINNGPVPPKVEKETTYTIIWSATNSSNDVRDTVMKATLPSYVSWLGAFVPAQEEMTFDPITRTVTWKIGDLRAGTGFASPVREVSFQVSLFPSLSQVGESPTVVNQTTISGRDTFTSAFLEQSRESLTTRLGTDPTFKNGDDKVTP